MTNIAMDQICHASVPIESFAIVYGITSREIDNGIIHQSKVNPSMKSSCIIYNSGMT